MLRGICTRFERTLGLAVAGIALTSLGLGGGAHAATTPAQATTASPKSGPVTAYVVDTSGQVTPIRGAIAGTPITTGSNARAIAITPNGKTAYIADGDAGTVTPIDTATNTAGHPIRTGTLPTAIAITPNGKTAYVAN